MSDAGLTVVLAEDEPLARAHLRELLAEDDDVVVVAECADGPRAVEAVRAHRPDLLLLDVEMPGMTGFDVLVALGDEAPPVVFVTAYDRYALRAFDLHAVDYVLKPVDDRRFGVALQLAKERARHGELQRLSRRLLDVLRGLGVDTDLDLLDAPPDSPSWLAVPVREGWRRLNMAEIDWVEGAGVYVHVHAGPDRFLLRRTMRDLGVWLPTPPFVRVHRSAIVNVGRVRTVRPVSNGRYVLVLDDETTIQTSRRYRQAVALLVRDSGDALPPLSESSG